MGLTKPIEQYLFSNLLIKIHVFMYLKDIIRGRRIMNDAFNNCIRSNNKHDHLV